MVVLLVNYECSLREEMSVQLVLVSSPIFQNKKWERGLTCHTGRRSSTADAAVVATTASAAYSGAFKQQLKQQPHKQCCY